VWSLRDRCRQEDSTVASSTATAWQIRASTGGQPRPGQLILVHVQLCSFLWRNRLPTLVKGSTRSRSHGPGHELVTAIRIPPVVPLDISPQLTVRKGMQNDGRCTQVDSPPALPHGASPIMYYLLCRQPDKVTDYHWTRCHWLRVPE
jgi:hypothetical protein